jgi:hypothetical protein
MSDGKRGAYSIETRTAFPSFLPRKVAQSIIFYLYAIIIVTRGFETRQLAVLSRKKFGSLGEGGSLRDYLGPQGGSFGRRKTSLRA